MSTLTIRARVTEEVNAEGIGFPKSVTVTGAEALSPNTIREIAQEAVDSMYGSYESGYIAVFNDFDKTAARKAGTEDAVTVLVDKKHSF